LISPSVLAHASAAFGGTFRVQFVVRELVAVETPTGTERTWTDVSGSEFYGEISEKDVSEQPYADRTEDRKLFLLRCLNSVNLPLSARVKAVGSDDEYEVVGDGGTKGGMIARTYDLAEVLIDA
jgi:hypothetical protein